MELVESKIKLTRWQKAGLQYTASGYGAKIPTSWVVRYRGRERRIYCTIYSNVGTCWIFANGKRLIVDDAYQTSTNGARMLEVTDRQFGKVG